MILFIDGSDINTLKLGRASIDNLGNWSTQDSVTIDVRPEGYLAAIDTFLANEDIEGIIAVTGPGSATSLRTSLAIVNSLSLAKSIKLYGITTPSQISALAANPTTTLSGGNILLPLYHHDPVITVSTRDSLLRTL